MTPTQLVALALLILAAATLLTMFIHTWRKTKLPKPRPEKATPPPPKYRSGPPHPPKPPYPPKSRLQPPQRHKLPKSFTNRPGVKQAQVNLKKAGYREDAKLEEDKPRRRRH